MLLEIIGCAAIVFGIYALLYKLEGQGRKIEQNDQMQQVLDDIYTADVARQRLDADAAFTNRVRDRFTR